MGVPSATYGSPRRQGKLQAAIESVASVDKPAPSALTHGHAVQFCVIGANRTASGVTGSRQRALYGLLRRW